VNRTDEDHIHLTGGLVTIPDTLKLGINGRVNDEELLKLINKQDKFLSEEKCYEQFKSH
jgi:hypothetical protein